MGAIEGSDDCGDLRALVNAEVRGQLSKLRQRVNALDWANGEEVEATIEDIKRPTADYDPSEPPLAGFALSRDLPDETLKLMHDVETALETAEHAVAAASEVALAEDIAILKRAKRLLKAVEDYIRLLPFVVMKTFVENISNVAVAPGSRNVAAAVAAIQSMDAFDRTETEHFNLLMTTADPLGAFLRGFVLIEGALNGCFAEFLARPLNLHKDLELYISDKIKLGHALGFLTDQEKRFLSELNAARNKLVHEAEAKKRAPRYAFNAAEERKLWTLFTAVPSMSRAWSEYDPSTFPKSVKIMLTSVLFLLNGRRADLKKLRLQPLDDALRRNVLERRMFGAIAILMVNVAPVLSSALEMGDRDDAREG